MPIFDYTTFNFADNIADCTNLYRIPTWLKQIHSIPKVKKIIFNNPATIVFWEDGTKTVVKCMKDQEFSKYYGFLAALGKKLYKNNSHLQRMIEQYGVGED